MHRAIRFNSLFSARRRCVQVETDELEGTGVIIESGLVFTNFHLVEPQTEILVDGRTARLIHFDLRTDFAALAVETETFSPVRIQSNCRKDQPVFYVGNPGNKVRAIQVGRIKSVKPRKIVVEIESHFGFSGSGLYNIRGELIGLTDSFEFETDTPEIPGNIGFAIPGNILNNYLPIIRDKLRLR